jgi:hypothetical protein
MKVNSGFIAENGRNKTGKTQDPATSVAVWNFNWKSR